MAFPGLGDQHPILGVCAILDDDGLWARPDKDAVIQPVKVRPREQVSPS